MIARPKMSRNEWKTTETRGFTSQLELAHPCPAQVAVKLVFDKDEGAPREMTTVTPKQWRTDFDREVAALRRIGLHPNCVAFYGVFDCDELRGFQIRFSPTSMCAYSNGSDQTL